MHCSWVRRSLKRPNLLELSRWSHTNRQIIRGSFQLSSQTDRNQTKWLKFLIDAATGIKASGVGTKRLCGNISPATDRMPTAAQVPNRNGSPSVVSIRRRPRNRAMGKRSRRTDGRTDPEVMAAEKISITSSLSIPASRKWPVVLLRKPCKCTFPAMTSIKPHRRIASQRTEPGTTYRAGPKSGPQVGNLPVPACCVTNDLLPVLQFKLLNTI